jgi:hypothetical protein
MMDLPQIYKQMRFKFRTLVEGMKSSVKSGPAEEMNQDASLAGDHWIIQWMSCKKWSFNALGGEVS